MMIWWKRS